MDAELEVQRTIRRVELTAFLYLLRKAIGTMMVHVDNNGIIDGRKSVLWPKSEGRKLVDLDLRRVA